MTKDESKAVAFVGILLCLALVARFVNRPKPITINAGAVDIEAFRAAGHALAAEPPARKSRGRKADRPATRVEAASAPEPAKEWRPAWQRGPVYIADSDAQRPAGKVNLNRASASEIESLPGIGPAVAQRIIARRDSIGRFERVEDLDPIKGIGPALIEKLRPLVVVR
jgi:competence protein ComEA